MRRVLCVVAHPDDEVLGAGATLAGHVLAGDDVNILMLADGETSRKHGDAFARSKMAGTAATALGIKMIEFLGHPDQRLDAVSLLGITQGIEEVVARTKPDTVYTHYIGDLNLDHAICARAVLTACRPLPDSSVRRIYTMEIPSSTEWAPEQPFMPNRFVGISAEALERKRKALEAYSKEIRPSPHARAQQAISAREIIRGHSVGLFAAEAFMTIREIVD